METKLNDVAKSAISGNFKDACKREGLNYSQAARLLHLRSDNYGNMIANEKAWSNISCEAWSQVQKWSNSGETLKMYGEKLGLSDYVKKEDLSKNDKSENDKKDNRKWEQKAETDIPGHGKYKPIDKVTTEYLDIALRMCGIQLNINLIDKVIDLVELIEDKGGQVSITDICELQAEWNNKPAAQHIST